LWTGYINFFVAFFTQVGLAGTWVSASDFESKLDALDTQNKILVVIALWTTLSATLASHAILHADRAVSSTS
jgi:hypothetical protein